MGAAGASGPCVFFLLCSFGVSSMLRHGAESPAAVLSFLVAAYLRPAVGNELRATPFPLSGLGPASFQQCLQISCSPSSSPTSGGAPPPVELSAASTALDEVSLQVPVWVPFVAD